MSEPRLGPHSRLAVRFLTRWQNYFRGDVASFPARMAVSLVASGRAERVNIAPPGAMPPEAAQFAIRMPANPTVKTQPDDDDFVF